MHIPRCPLHTTQMQAFHTSHGRVFRCMVARCEYRCWEGNTSTPGNNAIMQARSKAHAAFDPLWKTGAMTRPDAYRLLRKALGKTRKECHIGLFSEGDCQRVIEFCKERVQ